jgi:hypothetical protein|nr:MAG TPA: Head Tail Connector Protein [Caudoviricetes sp.]
MTAANVLPLLQVDLGELYPTDERKNYLSQVIDAAIAFITREGITLEDTVEDLQLVEMYAAYLVRKRNTTEAMPRMLRWALNNRLFSQKSGG